jgi:hypothetical protein
MLTSCCTRACLLPLRIQVRIAPSWTPPRYVRAGLVVLAGQAALLLADLE